MSDIEENQSWFFTKEWQKNLMDAEKEIKNKKYKSFQSLKEILNYLKGEQ